MLNLFRTLALVLLLAGAVCLPVLSNDNPTVAILRFGPLPSTEISEGAILDMLESYGFISSEENRILELRQDYQAQRISIIWGDANFDIPSVNLLVEQALDEEVDLLLTLGSTVTLAAVNATLDMDDPPGILFTAVQRPYDTGIGQAACIKPAHITGAETQADYSLLFEVLLQQDPQPDTIGVIFDLSHAGSVYGMESISSLAEEAGFGVEVRGVSALAEVGLAAEALVDLGADAIVLPSDSLTTNGLPIIVEVSWNSGIPVFYPSMSAIYYGATIGAGYSLFYDSGINLGRLATAYLNGELDISKTAISVSSGGGLGVNLDSAAQQNVEVDSELLEEADVVMKDGGVARMSRRTLAKIAARGKVIPLEQRQEADRAFLAALQCTDEMIAEQQAALDAEE